MALFPAACNLHADLDSVHYLGSQSDTDGAPDSSGPDANDARDAATDIDRVPDADAGQGDAVADADVESVLADECELLQQVGCDALSACVFDTEAGRTRCVLVEEFAEQGGNPEGGACASYLDCQVGLVCVDWAQPDPRGSVCSRPCDTGVADSGCAESEFCASAELEVGEGVGFCTPKCDILDPDATCESTERCVPDPFQPGVGFGENFRCLQNFNGDMADPGAPPKSMSSACSAINLHENGCPAQLTCLPVKINGERGEYCLQPCVDGDASSCSFFQSLDTCAWIPESPIGLGYCTQ